MLIIGSLHLITKVGEFVFGIVKSKNDITEKSIENLTNFISGNTEALHRLEERMRSVETELKGFDSTKLNVRKLFAAVKAVAGADWPLVKQAIIDDEIAHQ